MRPLLLDEHFPLALVQAIKRLSSAIEIESLHTWQEGRLLRCPDAEILEAASERGVTLVTFDVTTIPTLLQELAIQGRSHGGILFIPSRRIPQNDYGSLAKRIVAFWKSYGTQEWVDRVAFLPPA